jgi:hypothetical protein
MTSAEGTFEINVVASIVGSPHDSVEAVPSRAGFIEISKPLVKPWAQTGLQSLNLRDGALRAATTIETLALVVASEAVSLVGAS